MLYTCTTGCADPTHRHGLRALAATVAGRKATASAARAVVKTRKGSSKVIDLHCHYLNPPSTPRPRTSTPASTTPR